jgi:isoquinoline 1-oxidoreductase alpha subunit
MITLNVNGKDHALDVTEDTPILWALRDVIGLTGTKFGCGKALCGACTIHLDGQATRSCITPVSLATGKKITTIESIGDTDVGKRVQQAWLALDVVQCGYCQSGQIMSASALLAQTPNPTDEEIDNAMSGNICRCGTYPRIKAAIKNAAKA